jgi:hypothetical protein
LPASILWCLRISVAGQCIAAARTAWVAGSEINGWLFIKVGLPESVASFTDQVAAGLLLAVAASAIFRPLRALYLFNAAWMAAVCFAVFTNPGTAVDVLAPISHAVRVAAPLTLALLPLRPGEELRLGAPKTTLALWVLLFGVAATFTAHGLEALQHYGRFVDLIIGSAKHWLGWSVSQATAEQLLTVIGIQDILLALMLLSRRWRWVAGWMAIWGLSTALSRMTTMGAGSWHQSLIRIANGGVPLALFLGWWHLVRPSGTHQKS